MSETTTLLVEALKTLVKDYVDDGIILNLRNRLPEVEKKKMLDVRYSTKFKKDTSLKFLIEKCPCSTK